MRPGGRAEGIHSACPNSAAGPRSGVSQRPEWYFWAFFLKLPGNFDFRGFFIDEKIFRCVCLGGEERFRHGSPVTVSGPSIRAIQSGQMMRLTNYCRVGLDKVSVLLCPIDSGCTGSLNNRRKGDGLCTAIADAELGTSAVPPSGGWRKNPSRGTQVTAAKASSAREQGQRRTPWSGLNTRAGGSRLRPSVLLRGRRGSGSPPVLRLEALRCEASAWFWGQIAADG